MKLHDITPPYLRELLLRHGQDSGQSGRGVEGRTVNKRLERILSSGKRWKNTFAPHAQNKYFTPATLFGAVRYGCVDIRRLPPDAQKVVRKIVDEVYREPAYHHPDPTP